MSSQIPPARLSDDDLRVLRAALEGRPAWFDLSQVLESAAGQRASFGLKLVAMAFVYDMVPLSQGDRRQTAGGVYATMFESDEGTYPPRVAEVAGEVKTLWRAVLDAVDDPIVRARLADLIYVAEGPSAHIDGRRAAAAFTQLCDEQGWEAIERAECVARALEIHAELRDLAALPQTAQRAVGLVDELLRQEHPGPPFIVLRALLALKPPNRPADLRALLERVIARFEGSGNEAAALGFAADAAAEPAEKREFRRRQARLGWLRRAARKG